mmetsp:Transcript_7317/g.22484  ORF Transcript_7317/g.22484 Transcript_7317/m.22484 type:complete len:111 (-) Transcript_7317:2329-2661(-)
MRNDKRQTTKRQNDKRQTTTETAAGETAESAADENQVGVQVDGVCLLVFVSESAREERRVWCSNVCVCVCVCVQMYIRRSRSKQLASQSVDRMNPLHSDEERFAVSQKRK